MSDSDLLCALVRRSFRVVDAQSPRVERLPKSDGTELTNVDLAVDEALRGLLRRVRPADGVVSEEAANHVGVAHRRWIIDPIDGTADMLAGSTRWGTHIALEERGKVTMAAVTRPARRLAWLATPDIAKSQRWVDPFYSIVDVGPAATAPAPSMQEGVLAGLLEPDSPIPSRVPSGWTWRFEIDPLAALLDGSIDAFVDDSGEIWDQAPTSFLITSSGGVFLDKNGNRDPGTGWGLYVGKRTKGSARWLWTHLRRPAVL